MKGTSALCAIFTLALAGCGTSASPTPSPQPVRALAAATPLHPTLERQAGRLLAAAARIGEADHDLQTAYQLQDIQLPESAQASLGDARVHLQEAGLILRHTTTGAPLRAVWGMLREAQDLMEQARVSGGRGSSASRSESARADALLVQARERLRSDPDARTPLAARAENLVLQRSVIAPPAPRPTPGVTVVSSPRFLVADTQPTPIPRARRVVHSARRSTPRRAAAVVSVRTVPPATATATATPTTPTLTAGTLQTPTAKTYRTPTLPYSISLVAAVISAKLAAKRVQACSRDLQRLALGDDPLGSQTLLGCLRRALARAEEMQSAIQAMTTAPDSGTEAAGSAVSDLTQAQVDVQNTSTSDATTHLADAGVQVGIAYGYTLSAADSLG